MRDLKKIKWGSAFSEIGASIIGSIGILAVISAVISLQPGSRSFFPTFMGYFSGGQVGLLVLSLSGIMFITLKRHGPLNPVISVLLYIFFFLPIIATAIIVGLNPGFLASQVSSGTLKLLWFFFGGLHFLWFFILLLEPAVPSAQEAGKAQENRVNKIKQGAADRV